MSLPFFFSRQDQNTQNVLMAYADALVSGTPPSDDLLADVDEDLRDSIQDLFALAGQISLGLTQVVPSEQFVAELRSRLLDVEGVHYLSWLGRWRQLPPKTQIAAGIGGATLTAGVVLIAARSVSDVWDSWRSRREATA